MIRIAFKRSRLLRLWSLLFISLSFSIKNRSSGIRKALTTSKDRLLRIAIRKASCFFVATCHICSSSFSPSLLLRCKYSNRYEERFISSVWMHLLKKSSKILTLSHHLVNSSAEVGFSTRIDNNDVPVVLQSNTGVRISASAKFNSTCWISCDFSGEANWLSAKQKSNICFFDDFLRLGSFWVSFCVLE